MGSEAEKGAGISDLLLLHFSSDLEFSSNKP